MSELTAILRAQIETNGSLSVAEYMEAALAHPEYGYYRTHRISDQAAISPRHPKSRQCLAS